MLREKLFYWKSDEGIRFSKSKFFSILIFFDIFASRIYYTGDWGMAFSVALVASFFAFLIGCKIHKSIKDDYAGSFGLADDIKHLFFYWQDPNGFALSKTKIISLAVYLISVVLFCSYYGLDDIPLNLNMGIFFAVLAFLVGRSIHSVKKENSADEPPKVIPAKTKKKEKAVSNEGTAGYSRYRWRIAILEKEYSVKDRQARQLVEMAFEPPQLTYDRFIAHLDRCRKLFDNQIDAVRTLSEIAGRNTEAFDGEITQMMDTAKSIIDKIDSLNTELAIAVARSKSDDDDIGKLFEEMESLTDSLKDYDFTNEGDLILNQLQ